jgi:hypothetical protein
VVLPTGYALITRDDGEHTRPLYAAVLSARVSIITVRAQTGIDRSRVLHDLIDHLLHDVDIPHVLNPIGCAIGRRGGVLGRGVLDDRSVRDLLSVRAVLDVLCSGVLEGVPEIIGRHILSLLTVERVSL